MPFPQGGDFPHNTSRLFKILQSDKRICVNDNGTTVCDAGHKLKFPGTCFNQVVGTFNSTDATFQPTFSICTNDYESFGFHSGIIFSADEKEGNGIVVQNTTTVESFHPLFQLINSVEKDTIFYHRSNAEIIIAHFLQTVSNTVELNYFIQTAPSVYSTFLRIAQFNPGDLPYGENIFSDLYQYDVASFFTLYKALTFDRLEYTPPVFKIYDDLEYTQNLISTDYYTTISGEVDICVGDGTPPNITYHSPTVSGSILAPQNQLIDFSLADAIGGVNIASVYVSVSGTVSGRTSLVQGGINQVGSSLSISGDPDSYRFIYTKPTVWTKGEEVRITISGADLPPEVDGDPFYCGTAGVNYFVGDLWFKVINTLDMPATISGIPDSTPPSIIYSNPANGSTENNVFSPLELHIVDNLTGVNLSTLQVSVDGKNIVVNGVAQSEETSIDIISLGYSVLYEPLNAFSYDSTVVVNVSVSDKVRPTANSMSDTVSFTFISNDTLIIENFLPDVGTSIVQSSLNIEVDVKDDTYGIDTDQTYFIINNTIVSGTRTPTASGIRMSYHPTNEYDYGAPVRVKVHSVNGNSLAPVVNEQLYVLYYGWRLLYDNINSFNHQQNVNVFVRARNLQQYYRDLTTGYYFTTYSQPNSFLGAEINAINPISDLKASLQAIAPEHRYGQTVDVEFYIEDENGYAFGPYRFSYTIENRPG